MSISAARGYLRARMTALGYTEWVDGFNFENIPATLLDTRFHLETGSMRGVSNNQDSQIVEIPITLRTFYAATRDPKTLIDDADSDAQTILSALLLGTNRLAYSGLQNLLFDTLDLEPLDKTNDNGIIMKIALRAVVLIATR